MKKILVSFLLIGLCISFATKTYADFLYTVRMSDEFLVKINTNTLEFTDVGPLNLDPLWIYWAGLAYDTSSGVLYLTSPNTQALHRVDLETGEAIYVAHHGISGGHMSLAYDPETDQFYMGRSKDGVMFSVDKNTGQATEIGGYHDVNGQYVDIDSLGYNTKIKKLVGIGYNAGSPDVCIYQINPLNAEATLIGKTDSPSEGSLEHDPKKDIYWCINRSGDFFSIDPKAGFSTTFHLTGMELHDGLAYVEEKIEISIDIKPGSYPNSINLKSKGKVPVAILTTDDFDAQYVDPETCVFAGANPLRWNMCDLGKDGDEDMILHFKTQELDDLNKNSTEASLECETYDGTPIIGTDTVNIVPKCKGHDKKIKKHLKKNKNVKMKGNKGK